MSVIFRRYTKQVQKTCANSWCKATFEVTNDDLALYDKVSPVFGGKKFAVPPPTLCWDCRTQRRLAYRNERKLYHRKSHLSSEPIISLYSPDKPYKVFSQKEWWGDVWDAMEYGRDFDFSMPFFPQFKKLTDDVPKLPLFNIKEENADMCNFCVGNKDCYLVFGSDKNRNCYCNHWIYECKDTMDSSFCYNSELLYDCVDCVNCYECHSCQDCETSTDCFYSFDLKGCRNCFRCVGLRQKEYHAFNKPIAPEEFKILRQDSNLASHHREQYERLKVTIPRRFAHAVNAHNFVGDFMVNSQNIFWSFDVRNSKDVRYSNDIFDQAKDCMDCAFTGEAELCYEAYEVKGFQVLFCNRLWWPCSSSLYLDNCDNCSHCFGCSGLRRKEHCIFNKEFTKLEYEHLVPRIIEHMQKTGEWGEFFPASDSPFGYNETSAEDYYPMSEEEAVAKGFNWSHYETPKPNVKKIIPASALPSDIKGIPDDILEWAIECEITQKPFRIIKQELDFYRRERLPIPKRHPDQRHQDRLARRNPRKLWNRTCGKCGKEIQTTYSPDHLETVYCEQCYLATVY